MRRILFTALIVACCLCHAEAQQVYRYWVTFADKAGTPYTLDNPSAYLGPRALERRAKIGIGIDSLDLPVNPAYLEYLRQAGGTVWSVSKWLNGAVVFSDNEMAATLEALPCVQTVTSLGQGGTLAPEAEESYGYDVDTVAYDSIYDRGYYGYGHRNIRQLNLMPLHRAGYDGRGVMIGVCDAGFPGVESRKAFAALRESGRLVATRNFAYADNDVYCAHMHGTSVLSCMAGLHPGRLVGSAPQASYVLCITERTEEESPIEELLWASAVEWMDSLGVDIVNTSLGYVTFDDITFNHPYSDFDGRTAPLSRAAETAVSRGMMMVVAAGNDGYLDTPSIYTPADAESVLTVGAVSDEGGRAFFSSWGPTADGRIKPDVMALGESSSVVLPDGNLLQLDGTSFASPIMAGAVACVMQMHPRWSPARICDSLRTWGDNALTPDNENGYGIPDISRAMLAVDDTTDHSAIAVADVLPCRLYPNPVESEATLTLPAGMPVVEGTLYDALGRRRMDCRLSGGQHRLDLRGLEAGVYVLHLTSPVGRQTLRLIKR